MSLTFHHQQPVSGFTNEISTSIYLLPTARATVIVKLSLKLQHTHDLLHQTQLAAPLLRVCHFSCHDFAKSKDSTVCRSSVLSDIRNRTVQSVLFIRFSKDNKLKTKTEL